MFQEAPTRSRKGHYKFSVKDGGLLKCVGENAFAKIEHEFLIGTKDYGQFKPANVKRLGLSLVTWNLELNPWEKYCSKLDFFVR